MSSNGISTLSTKQLKQVAKLNLAMQDRQRVGNIRSAYDITELPTQYNNNGITDNPNSSGLVQGRPWLPLQSGIYQYHYNGYWNNTISFFTGNSPSGHQIATNFEIGSESTNHSELFAGYFLSDYTGVWTFSMTSDDASNFWIGNNAVSGYTIPNALISSTYNTGAVTGTVNLVAGSYYPILIMYGNGAAGGSLSLSYSHPGQSSTTDYTNKLYYNPVTNGI